VSATTPGHEFRCWFPVGSPEGKAALERNRVAAEAALMEADAATRANAAATGLAASDAAPDGSATGGSD
jgi:hypothetical protein